MERRSRYQSLSKKALIEELHALHERYGVESTTDQPFLGVSLSKLEQLFVDHLSDSVILTDSETRIVHWNVGSEKMFGYSTDEVIGRIGGEVLHLDHTSEVRASIRRGLEAKGHWIGKIPSVTKNGTTIVCDSVILRRVGEQGQDLGAIGINRNTGWQSRAETAEGQQLSTQSRLDGSQADLAESVQRYKELIECIPDMVWTVDADRILTYVSPAAESVTGFKPSELIGNHLFDTQNIVRDSPESLSASQLYDALVSPQAREDGFVSRHVYSRADGSFLDAEVRVSLQLDSQGNVVGLNGITRDVSGIVQAQQAQLKLEAQLMQSQKMEAIGLLAGGIAHDLNNVLTAIMGNTELMLGVTDRSDSRFFGLTEIDKASQRAARMMKNLLAFSRQQDLRPQFLDLREIVKQMDVFLEDLLGERITLATDIPLTPLWVVADSGQLEQVVMNLVINAGDATAHDGEITVGLGSIDLDDQSKVALPTGRYARLSVSDTGSGIEPAALPRVFEPFYTTKKPNLGTGLGLSSAYGIIQQSGGTIDVVSEVGMGTTFSLYLPLASKDAMAENAESLPTPAQPVRQRPTILIAEDNPEVGVMLQQALENDGYSVLLASSGEEALVIARRALGRIDLLVTDYDMPGMNGLELSRELLTLQGETKVLHISGHSESLFDESVDGEAVTNFLSKPFGPRALLEKAHLILDVSE